MIWQWLAAAIIDTPQPSITLPPLMPNKPFRLAAFFNAIVSAIPRRSKSREPSEPQEERLSIVTAASRGSLPEVERLLRKDDGRPSAKEIQQALYFATECGNIECVKVLMVAASPKDGESYALSLAARNGRPECVEALIPLSEPRNGKSRAIELAATRGCVESIRLLIPASRVTDRRSGALRSAAERGHVECVKLLAPLSDHRSTALRLSASKGHSECALILLGTLSRSSAILHGDEAASQARLAGFESTAAMIEEWILAQSESLIIAAATVALAPRKTSARMRI